MWGICGWFERVESRQRQPIILLFYAPQLHGSGAVRLWGKTCPALRRGVALIPQRRSSQDKWPDWVCYWRSENIRVISRNKQGARRQPAVWMAQGVSSSVNLVQGGHAVTTIQLRLRAFCEYLRSVCAPNAPNPGTSIFKRVSEALLFVWFTF